MRQAGDPPGQTVVPRRYLSAASFAQRVVVDEQFSEKSEQCGELTVLARYEVADEHLQ
ncbi:hypothetical protein [Mycolicibacterium sediminis]|uniref:hypothetical protein n=1 Tax=Mycolicibacterium sediminis TaxID=1286180 RepID=UPI0013D8DCBD|nr:hypothetical protein [Mycolicibacterium sediminis]